MGINIFSSTNPVDYEILIRKQGDGNYASYCPQLNMILYGEAHEVVLEIMRNKIDEHIFKLQDNSSEND